MAHLGKAQKTVCYTRLQKGSSLFQITFTTAADEVGPVRKKLHERFPEYNLTGATVTGHVDIRNLWTLYTILYILLPCGPISLLILYLRKKVN